jgi:hypothetical protein
MLDKEEIVVPAYNPTIDLTADSDHEAEEEEHGEIPTPRNKKQSSRHDFNGKGKSMTTPGTRTFRPHGSIFQNEISLPDDDPSSRYRTRQWHSPSTAAAGAQSGGQRTPAQTQTQRPNSRGPMLGMSFSRTPLRNGTPRGPISPTPVPSLSVSTGRYGQGVSSLTSSMARLNSARNGSVASSSAEYGGRERWGLSVRQKESLDRIVPKFGKLSVIYKLPLKASQARDAYRDSACRRKKGRGAIFLWFSYRWRRSVSSAVEHFPSSRGR